MLAKQIRKFLWLSMVLWAIVPISARADTAQIEYCISEDHPASPGELSQCRWAGRRTLTIDQFLQPKKWVRVRTQKMLPDGKSSQDIAIHVAPHFIASITLYRAQHSGTYTKEATAGSLYSDDKPYDMIGGYLFLTKSNSEASTYLLEIETYLTGYVGIAVESWPSTDIQSQLGLGLHLGALFLILIYACSSYLISPNALMGRFATFLGCSFVSVLAGSGILAHYVFINRPNYDLIFFALISSARLAFWVWLCQAFLEPFNSLRWYRWACYFAYLISAICLLLSFDLRGEFIQPMLITGTALISIAQIYAVHKASGIDPQYRRLLTIGFSTIAIILLAMSATALLPVFPENMAIHIARVTVILPILLIASLIIYQNRKTRDDLIAVRNELDAANIQRALKEKLHEERRMMMDMLTHELRNPLATISLATQSVTDQIQTTNPEVERRIFKINQAVSNMDAVIERCNLANMANQEELRVERSYFDIGSLLKDLIEVLPAPERVQMRPRMGMPIHLVSDPYLIQIIFSNLLENALKYALSNSEIIVSFDNSTTNSLRISVSNFLDSALTPDSSQLFERFYRHPAAHRTSGTGLGLFLIKRICIRLGGSIQSEITQDTITFIVELPK